MSQRRERGARSKQIVEREGRHIAPGYQGLAQYAGLAMARGSGCTLIDEDGNEYIDFMAGIAVGSVGHCHPDYVDALKRQLERLTFGSFTTETRAKFLELLASVTPEGLSRIQLFSGGAEAVEEPGARLRREAAEGQPLYLLLQRLDVVGMAVADAADADAGDEVDVLVAVLVDQRRAAAAGHRQARVLGE